MSKAFNEAVSGQSAIRTVNIYFHRQRAEGAQELGVRIQADGAGQAFATRTQGDLVRSYNDVAACDAVAVDLALGEQQIATILRLHDELRYPYEVHRIAYDPRAKVFDFVKETARDQTAPAPAAVVPSDVTGTDDGGGPRPADPPDVLDDVPASRDQRARRRSGGGAAG